MKYVLFSQFSAFVFNATFFDDAHKKLILGWELLWRFWGKPHSTELSGTTSTGFIFSVHSRLGTMSLPEGWFEYKTDTGEVRQLIYALHLFTSTGYNAFRFAAIFSILEALYTVPDVSSTEANMLESLIMQFTNPFFCFLT